MINFYLETLEKLIVQLKGTNKKSILIVFKGFETDFLNEIALDKLTSLSFDIDIQYLNNEKPNITREVLIKSMDLEKDSIVWCSYEEFLTLTEEILSMYFDIKIIKNNIYHHTFPVVNKIDNIEELYNQYFEDKEVNLDDIKENETLDIFLKYYGDLKKVDLKFYVTYHEEQVCLASKKYTLWQPIYT